MPEVLIYMRQNYLRWKEFDEQGHTTVADIRKLQTSTILSPMFPCRKDPLLADIKKKDKQSEWYVLTSYLSVCKSEKSSVAGRCENFVF